MPTVEEFLKQYGGGKQNQVVEQPQAVQPQAQQPQPAQTNAVDQFLAQYGGRRYQPAVQQPVQSVQPVQPASTIQSPRAPHALVNLQNRNAYLQELRQLEDEAPYAANEEQGLANAQRRRELTNALEAMDAQQGNAPRYYDEATRAKGVLDSWVNRTGGSYLSAFATLGQFKEQDDGRSPLADSPYAKQTASQYKTNKEMLEYADELLGKGEEAMAKVYNGASTADRVLADVTGGALDVASDALVNSILPGAGKVMLGARAFGQEAYQQRKQGHDIDKQILGGIASAGIEILTESIFEGPWGNIYGKGLIGKGAKEAGEDVVKLFGRKITTPVVRNGIRILGDAIQEGAEEVIGDILQPVTFRLLKINEDESGFNEGWFKEDYWNKDFLVNTLYDGAIGGLLGGIGAISQSGNRANVKAAIEKGATEAVDRALAEHSSPGSLTVGTPSSAPAEQYVANLFGNVKTQEDAIRAIETIRRSRSRLAYEQAFYDLTGMELDDYAASLSETPQNGAEAKEAPNRQITPGEGATASAQPSDEFNSGNGAVEERGLDFSEVDEAATNQARAQNAVLDAWNTQKTYSTTPSAASAVDMLIGDQYNKMRGQTVRNSDLSRGAYISQALRDSKYTGDGSFDEAVDLAREIVKDDWRNESRIMEGEGEWASMSPKMRAKVLNALQNGNEYYVRGNEVIKADSRLDLDKYTDERDVEGRYGEDLKRAGVPDRTVTKEEVRSDIGLDRMSDEDIERFIPRERAPDFRKDEDAPRARKTPQVSGKERAELETMAKRDDARRHRINFEMWLQENNIDPNAPLVHDPRLGTPRVEIRDVTSQAVMRSKRLLTDLVRGENGFAGWPVSERLDLLRSIYPEANWSLSREPADQRAIEANKRQIAEWDAEFKEWRAEHNDDGQSEMRYRQENPRPKPLGSYVNTITLGQRGLSSNGRLFGERSFDWKIDKPKPKQTVKGETSESNKEQSSGRPVGTEGTTRRISQRALEQDVEKLWQHGRVRDANLGGGVESDGGTSKRGNEERNAGAAPLLTSEAEVKEWKEGVETAKKKGWKFIGNLTQAMAEVNKFLNKFGVPCTHCDTSTSTEYGNKRAGGFAGLRNIFLGWGGFSNASINCKAVHEVTHQRVKEKLGESATGAKPCAKALLKSSASPDVLKGVVDNYRKADGEKYAKRRYDKTYSELDTEQKRCIDNLVYDEIFSDACAKNFTYKMHDAGLTMPQLEELHGLCLDQAEAFGIFTKEERGWIEDFLKKPLKDDYRQELENEKKRIESKNEVAREDDSFRREAQRKREAEFKNGEYTYVPSSYSGKVEAKALPKRIESTEKYSTMSQEEYDKKFGDLDTWSYVEENSDDIPQSAKEYASKLQREARKRIDEAEYNEQRREREKTREAEEAEYMAQREEDEKAAKEREDADRLAEAKHAFGKSHEALTKIGKELSDLVGNSRLTTIGGQTFDENGKLVGGVKGEVREDFSYREGGHDLEPVVNAFNDMVNGKATFKDVVEAYRGLGKTGKDGKVNGYFFDGSFYRQLEGIMDDIESGNVTNKDGSFKPDFTKRVETAAEMMERRFGLKQAKLTTRAEAGNAFTDPDKKVATGRKHDANNLFKRINLAQLRPSTAFRSFAGYAQKAGKVWYDLAEKATDSVRRYINTYQTAQEYFRDLTQHKDWKAFSQGKITVQNVVPGLKTGLKGNRLSANMALGYLKTLETEGAIDHIVDNGIVETSRNEKEYWSGRANKGFGNKNGYSQMFDMVSEETRAEIESALASHDDYALDQARAKAEHELENVKKALKSEISKVEVAQKAYDASFKVMGYLKRCLNSTSRSVWGVDFAVQNKFYWPLAAGGDRAGGELLNGSSWGLNNARNIQMREGSSGGLKIEAFTDVMENYIRWASEWSSYQGISDELDILSRNYRDTKSITQLLQDNVGSHAVKWLNNYVADLNGTREGERMAWLGKMRGKVAQGSLLLNGSVALKQAPSGLDFMGILDADIVAKRFFTGSWRSARYFRNNELINTINQHTGMLTNRQMGYNIVEQGEAAEAMRKDAVDKFVQSLPGFMTNWITKTDYRTVANGMLACADQINRYIKDGKPGYEGMEKGSYAYNEAVADLFERAVIDTQPIYNKQYRADYLRTTNEFLRTLGMFRTQQTQNYNNLVESLGELAAAKREGSKSEIKAAQKRVRGTIGGQVSAAMMFSMLGTAAKLLLHKQKDYEDDEGKFDWNKVLQRTGFNALNSVISTSWLGSMISPFLIDRSTQILSGLTGGKVVATNEYYATEDSVLGLINDVTDAAQNLINNPSPKTWKAMALSTAAATGLPLRNVYNMLNTVVMYSLDDPFKWLGLKGTNYKNEDDFMNIMNEWYAADSKKRGKITMERALSLRDNESYDLARMLLSTIDPQDKEAKNAIKSVLTNAFVTGQIDEKTYRDFVHNYAKVDIEDVNKLVDAANAKVEWEKAQTRATNGDAALAKEWDQQLGEYSGENDPDGSQRMNVIMDFGLDDEDTDAFVSHYLPKKFNTYYDALREGGFSPSRANRIIQAINFDDNTSISQDEMWASFMNDPSSEAYIELLWNASGYTGKNTKTWADYKRSKGR